MNENNEKEISMENKMEIISPKTSTKLTDMMELLDHADGYMVGFTTIKDGKLNHYLFTETFPFVDMLKSMEKMKKIAIGFLEKGAQDDSNS